MGVNWALTTPTTHVSLSSKIPLITIISCGRNKIKINNLSPPLSTITHPPSTPNIPHTIKRFQVLKISSKHSHGKHGNVLFQNPNHLLLPPQLPQNLSPQTLSPKSLSPQTLSPESLSPQTLSPKSLPLLHRRPPRRHSLLSPSSPRRRIREGAALRLRPHSPHHDGSVPRPHLRSGQGLLLSPRQLHGRQRQGNQGDAEQRQGHLHGGQGAGGAGRRRHESCQSRDFRRSESDEEGDCY
uniref:Uncharacterized protein n=1 Tax=Daucus carota subsp. sativus TaxID=79200 RepID=A0A166GER7_DAUCS